MDTPHWWIVEYDGRAYYVDAVTGWQASEKLKRYLDEIRPYEPGWFESVAGFVQADRIPREFDRAADLSLPAAVADGPVAHHSQPVAAEAGVSGAEPDRDDGDAMPHG